MTTRDRAPLGAPCWTDLWTSDIEGSRAFYASLFGWEALEPSPEFGGYFMFQRDGVPVAGCMGDMGPDMPANDTWKIYLATEDISTTAGTPRTRVAKSSPRSCPWLTWALNSSSSIRTAPPSAPGNRGPFPDSPCWMNPELRVGSSSIPGVTTGAVDFYPSVFHLESVAMSDTDEFRYTTLNAAGDSTELAGIMDAAAFLPEGVPSYWAIYWEVADIDASAATTRDLGGSVVEEPMDTPYGRMATVTDPAGAQFKLRTGPQ